MRKQLTFFTLLFDVPDAGVATRRSSGTLHSTGPFQARYAGRCVWHLSRKGLSVMAAACDGFCAPPHPSHPPYPLSCPLTRRRWLAGALGAVPLTLVGGPALGQTVSSDTAALLRRGGVVVAFRHALAPGTFDPPGFRLGDCSTQRNLSAEGREQARRMGAWFAAQVRCAAAPGAAAWTRQRWRLARPRRGAHWPRPWAAPKPPPPATCSSCAPL